MPPEGSQSSPEGSKFPPRGPQECPRGSRERPKRAHVNKKQAESTEKQPESTEILLTRASPAERRKALGFHGRTGAARAGVQGASKRGLRALNGPMSAQESSESAKEVNESLSKSSWGFSVT